MRRQQRKQWHLAIQQFAKSVEEEKARSRAPRPGVCHVCHQAAPVTPFPFGLIKHLSTKRDWGDLGKRFAFATLFAIPAGVLGLRVLFNPIPGKIHSGEVLRLQLLLCATCVERRRGWFRRVRLTWGDYASHPQWSDALAAGFTTWLSDKDLEQWHPLPDERVLKHRDVPKDGAAP